MDSKPPKQVSRLAFDTALRLGALCARRGMPISSCPYKLGPDGEPDPRTFAFIRGYRSVIPLDPAVVSYEDDDGNEPDEFPEMLAVHGYIDGVAYAVTVGRARPEARATVGVVSGSPRAVDLIARCQGEVVASSLGARVLDANDTLSVIMALRQWTQVVKVEDVEEPSR
ncbi:hypothetical protein [Planomonospora algeriensis]